MRRLDDELPKRSSSEGYQVGKERVMRRGLALRSEAGGGLYTVCSRDLGRKRRQCGFLFTASVGADGSCNDSQENEPDRGLFAGERWLFF